MLSQLARQQEANGGLDLTGSNRGSLVVLSQASGFRSNPLEEVVHKGVHDGHGLRRDSRIRMNLFQDLVDVNGITLPPLLLALLPSPRLGSSRLVPTRGHKFGRFARGYLLTSLWRHDYDR